MAPGNDARWMDPEIVSQLENIKEYLLDVEQYENWKTRCRRDLQLSARVNIKISTQDVSVITKDVKMTFTGAVANLGERKNVTFDLNH